MDNVVSAAEWAANTTAKFQAPPDLIRKGTRLFVKQLRDGLTQDRASLLQVPSYVVKLPDGSEKGICLAIDLGGTNLRVISVELHGDSTYSLVQTKAAIPMEIMTAASYKDLFRFIAKHTEVFMLNNLPGKVEEWRYAASRCEGSDEARKARLHALGFTFSFTFDQHAINKGTLMYWTKSFSIGDAIGRDPGAMLQEAFDEIQLPLLVTALVNDTVGTLAARSYSSPGTSQTLLAAIFGTGTNGAYMERMDRITKLHGDPEFSQPQSNDLMALNTEWGGFDNELSVLPVTEFDEALDLASANPRDQYYEKRISGLYLGEILRRVLVADLCSDCPSLSIKPPSKSRLHVPHSIDSSFLSRLVLDQSIELSAAKTLIVQTLETESVSLDDAKAIRAVAFAIGQRAARLSAIAIAGVVLQSERLETSSDQAEPDNLLSTPIRTAPVWRRIVRVLMKPLWALMRLCNKGVNSTDSMAEDDAKSVGSMTTSEKETTNSCEIIDIGVDGSLFEHFPGFEDNIRAALREIPEIGAHGERRIRMSLTGDGSGVGAALVAWSASRGGATAL